MVSYLTGSLSDVNRKLIGCEPEVKPEVKYFIPEAKPEVKIYIPEVKSYIPETLPDNKTLGQICPGGTNSAVFF